MKETVFDQMPLWLLFVGTAVLLFGGSQAGFRLGAWQRARRSEDDKAPTNAIMGSTLGLLAFMLAFTFGMSSSRFDTRRQLVLDEASAILRAYQRVQFLPDSQRIECSRLLREYVEIRIGIPELRSMADIQQAVEESESIQDELWVQAVMLADGSSTMLRGFTQSLSELTDLQMKRVRAGIWNRIPTTIVVMLYCLAFFGLMTMGYGAGLAGSRPAVPSVVLFLAFAAIIVLMVDLERPRQKLFQVSQEPMTAVARRMQVSLPAGD